MNNLNQKQKEMLLRLLTQAIESLHSDLCLEELSDESAFLLSMHYQELSSIRHIVKGEDNER